MSQSTLGDDDLFGEAADEMRGDVEASLADAREALPDADDVWDVDADNALGVLNALRSELDVGDATEDLHDAKKWYTMGERADAFDDASDLAEEIERLEALVEDVEAAREEVGGVASTLPQIRSELQEFEAADADDESEDGAAADADADADAEAEA